MEARWPEGVTTVLLCCSCAASQARSIRNIRMSGWSIEDSNQLPVWQHYRESISQFERNNGALSQSVVWQQG